MENSLIGSVIGDIVGSRFEFSKTFPKKDFKLFGSNCSFTDDSVLSVAIADALLTHSSFKERQLYWALRYPNAGYGKSFKQWLKNPVENGSKGNGCGMKISPVGFYAQSLEQALNVSKEVACITHNSQEGITGAQAVAAAVFMAKKGDSKGEIKEFIQKNFGYNLELTEPEIRGKVNSYVGGEGALAINSIPVAIIAFLMGTDYENTIRTAVSFGGDTDTIACIAGGIAAAFYGVPQEIINQALELIPQDMLDIINAFDGTAYYNHRITPSQIDRWYGKNNILVYGVGESLAYIAVRYFRGRNQAAGLKGRSYAIPMNNGIACIQEEIGRLEEYIKQHPEQIFLFGKIGISGGGFDKEEIMSLLRGISSLSNVYLPTELRI